MTEKKITLAMGAGGRASADLIGRVFLPLYGNEVLNKLEDAAEIDFHGVRLAFTTDCYTVKPIFFPGGDIGKLAVCGTVNDLVVKGAKPRALSAGFIIEEGFPVGDLEKIAASISRAADKAGVRVVAGDTKVVPGGQADGLFVSSAGIGTIMDGMNISCSGAMRGDEIIVSGTVGEHGMAIINARERLGFTPEIESDVADLVDLLDAIADLGPAVHAMRDLTRGGLAGVLNEIARSSKITMAIRENSVPLRREVRACCGILGIDPLCVASEGRAAIFVDHAAAEEVMSRIRLLPACGDAAVIGRVESSSYCEHMPPVSVETSMGIRRFLPFPDGEVLPRIC